MAPSDLRLEAEIRKLWEIHFFLTPHIFANGTLFVALSQLRPTKTGSKIFFKYFYNFFRNAEWVRWVRILWVYAPKNFPIETF